MLTTLFHRFHVCKANTHFKKCHFHTRFKSLILLGRGEKMAQKHPNTQVYPHWLFNFLQTKSHQTHHVPQRMPPSPDGQLSQFHGLYILQRTYGFAQGHMEWKWERILKRRWLKEAEMYTAEWEECVRGQHGAVMCKVCHRWFRSRGGLAMHWCSREQNGEGSWVLALPYSRGGVADGDS